MTPPLTVRADASLKWSLARAVVETDVSPSSQSAYWSADFSYRRNGDTVFVTIQDPFSALAGRSPDTLFVQADGRVVNIVEVGGGCQYDPTCVPGGEFRDAAFQYRRVAPN